MKKVFLALYLFNIAITGYSQNLTVAVTDFTARSGYSEAELGNITELFSGFLLETKKFKVLTRSQFGAILKEFDFQFNGYVADTEMRQLGKALGASAVITGTLMKLGNSNILNISLLNVESGEMQSAARRTFNNIDELLDLMPALSTDIAKMLEPPSVFVGTWAARTSNNSGQGVWEFKNDGTFIVTDYERFMEYSAEHGYVITGTIKGTYSHTDSSLTLNYTISGTQENYDHRIRINTRNTTNFNENGSCTVRFSISSDKKKFSVGTNRLFLYYEKSDSFTYLTNFTKIK